ncbi:MAG: sel1 repeat family protein [Acidobacteria bacterium]|nr:sel1 repeat family protein [Acidobacteriota bacterium]
MKLLSTAIAIVLLSGAAISQESEITLIQKASAGDAASQNRLGAMYLSGEGTSQDLRKAFDWFTKSAQQGNAEGQYNLALMYEKGEGIKANCVEAAKWYSKAAEQNHAFAIDNLLAIYERGSCLKKDDPTSGSRLPSMEVVSLMVGIF